MLPADTRGFPLSAYCTSMRQPGEERKHARNLFLENRTVDRRRLVVEMREYGKNFELGECGTPGDRLCIVTYAQNTWSVFSHARF